MSKGSTRRPTQVPKDEADRRWEKTFGEFAKRARLLTWQRDSMKSIMEREQPRVEARTRDLRRFLDAL